jgi:hypothetical protein
MPNLAARLQGVAEPISSGRRYDLISVTRARYLRVTRLRLRGGAQHHSVITAPYRQPISRQPHKSGMVEILIFALASFTCRL